MKLQYAPQPPVVQLQQLTLTQFQAEQKRWSGLHTNRCKTFLKGLKKHIHFTASSFGGLPAGKKTTYPIERRLFDAYFCPCVKAARKVVYSLNNKLYLLLPAHPTVAS